jgi:hypothetical protein
MNSTIINFFTVSTKARISMLQYPILTKNALVDYFYKEVKYQNHATLKQKEDSIHFTVTPFTSKYLNSRNKFNSYSEAIFTITEKDNILTVSFIGLCKNILYVSAVLPIFIFIASVFFIIAFGNPFYVLLAPLAPILFFVIISLLLLFIQFDK